MQSYWSVGNHTNFSRKFERLKGSDKDSLDLKIDVIDGDRKCFGQNIFCHTKKKKQKHQTEKNWIFRVFESPVNQNFGSIRKLCGINAGTASKLEAKLFWLPKLRQSSRKLIFKFGAHLLKAFMAKI